MFLIKFRLFLQRYSQPVRYTATCSFLFFLLLIWYLFFYRNLEAYIAQATQEIEILSKHGESAKQNLQKPVNTDNNHYLKLYKNKIIELYGHWAHERLLWVIDCLDSNKITLVKTKPFKSKNNKELYFAFFTQSDFNALYNFFICISQSPYFIECLRCDIKKISDTLVASKFLLKFSVVNKNSEIATNKNPQTAHTDPL